MLTVNKEGPLIDWSENKIQAFRETLLDWYDQEKRDIPWRHHSDNPYYIWVSEIMLQQTQVATVIPYFERFIETLPTIQSLAEADEDTLMHLWQGLGYYSRVRNMQTAAKQIMNDYNGVMPQTYEELLTLKGIGPYTAAAIVSIAYNIPEPALDGNLIRIVTRLFNLHDDITKAKSKRLFRDIYKILIDPDRPGDFNQALMDIGATIMTASNPYPDPHPLKAFDASYEAKTAHLLPNKPKKIKQTHHLMNAYIVYNSDGEVLMRKHQKGELLQDLWHFPIIEQEAIQENDNMNHLVEFREWLSTHGIEDSEILRARKMELPLIKHVFSHRIWELERFLIVANSFDLPEGMVWVNKEELKNYPISTLQKKLLKDIKR